MARALSLALVYLGRRERTCEEVRRRLAREQLAPEVIEEALASLGEDGLLDDARYARLFTQDKRTLEGWGSERIRRALRERGIERELVEDALAEELSPPEAELPDEPAAAGAHGELARALALLRQRFPQPPGDRRERDRALGMLLRKGYDSEVAVDALARHAACSRDLGIE